jgi:hypothetical protein
MKQMDLFNKNHDHYFLCCLEKMDTSHKRHIEQLFWMITEANDEILSLKNMIKKLSYEKNASTNAFL